MSVTKHGSNKRMPQTFMRKGLSYSSATYSRKSLSDSQEVRSYTSSQLSLRRGEVPDNTPDEQAVYRIKRSASCETEEFLKIDISVRGNTSYLPSEARRIHTPPLPQDGLNGRKRGFFFDYSAPPSPMHDNAPSFTAAQLTRNHAADSSIGRASTIGTRVKSFTTKQLLRAKTSDWYDNQLARLDDSEDELDGHKIVNSDIWKHDALFGGSNAAANSCSALIEGEKRKEEEFDMTIPEHLPSSPLCPRHPRYWRVVQGRGSQFRGCWMHGVGEYPDKTSTAAAVA